MTEPDNPYAAPLVESPSAILAGSAPLQVIGEFLVVNGEATLPNRCPFTNQPIEPRKKKRKTLYWTPVWARFVAILAVLGIGRNNVLAFGGIIVLAIVLMVTRKTCYLYYAIDHGLRKKIRNRTIAAILGNICGVGLLSYSLMEEKRAGMILAGVLIIGSLILASVFKRIYGPRNAKMDYFTSKVAILNS
jgi:hypothetical protein